MVRMCETCGESRAMLRRPKTFEALCRECFYTALEEEVHHTIITNKLFKRGERVALAASGGKDSTVLAHIVTTLNARYDYGLDLLLLSIDEGISGYRDDSLDTVKRNEETYGIPLHVFSYKDLYGWTMDEIVAQIGTKSNCTFCGVFRRQALDRGAAKVNADKIATGHNADDIAETVLLNILRTDVPRLGRCASAVTGEDGSLPRVKPFKYTYEKEIVMYAYFKRLIYFSTECKYSPFAARGFAREFVKDLEAARPRAIVDLVKSAERLRIKGGVAETATKPGTCTRCGYLSSQKVCKACMLLEGLNKGMPRLGVTRRKKGDTSSITKYGETEAGSVDNGNGSGGGGACGPGCCKAEDSGSCLGTGEEKEQPQFEYLQRKVDIAAHPSARKQ
jgi:cytoplasmic tRNA 2-thiolation protein 1